MTNKIKYKDKIQKIDSLVENLPFKACYSCKVVLTSDLFSPYDVQLPLINEFLEEIEDEERSMFKEIYSKALSYTIAKIKENDWHDQNGCEINDKFRYFKSSLLSNIKRVKQNIVSYKCFDDSG